MSLVGTLTRYRALAAALWLQKGREKGEEGGVEGVLGVTQERKTRLELVP
jgi:hypothetical protein